MRRTLVIVGALLVLAVTGLFAGPMLVDWDRYRGAFEEEATRVLGREVRVGGRLSIRFLPMPYLHLEKVRVADTQAAIGEPLFRADAFTAWLALSPLLSGTLEARRVEITRPVVNLVLDQNGSGNWASLATRPRGAGEAMPPAISLDAVDITDGTITVRDADGRMLTQLGAINGELSATALEGPYRVQVTMAAEDRGTSAARFARRAPLELRLSTAKPDSEGTTRIKASLRGADGRQNWSIDGTIADLFGRVRAAGSVTGRFATSDAGQKQGARSDAVDLKAAFKADAKAVELVDLALSIESGDRLQLVSGAARLPWQGPDAGEILLESRWLDIDALLGLGDGQSMGVGLGRLASAIERSVPTRGRLRALVLIDQASFNRDLIGALRADIEIDGEAMTLRDLTASLPGGARLAARGRITPPPSEMLFDGVLTITGTSFNRLVGWAGRGLGVPLLRQDGAFSLSGDIRSGPNLIDGRGMTLRVGATRLTGRALWSSSAGPRIALALEGPSLDLGLFSEQPLRPRSFLDRFSTVFAVPAGANAGAAVTTPIDAELRLGRLITVDGVLRDVDLALVWDGQRLTLTRVRIIGPGDWSLELGGTIGRGLDGSPGGLITGLATSPSGAATRALLSFLELPPLDGIAGRVLESASPLRLATRLLVRPAGGGRPAEARVTLQGVVAGQAAEARLDIGYDDLMAAFARGGTLLDKRLAINARVDGAPLALWQGRRSADAAARQGAETPGTGRFVLAAAGRPDTGLTVHAFLNDGGLEAEWHGRSRFDARTETELSGLLRVTTTDVDQALASVMGTAGGSSMRTPAEATFDVALKDGRLVLETGDLTLGGTVYRGRIALAQAGDVVRLEGRLGARHLRLAHALPLLLDPAPTATSGTRPEGLAAGSPWSEAPFDLARLAGLEGRIQIEAKRLEIADGLEITDANVDVRLGKGVLSLDVVNARARSGRIAAEMTLSPDPAGVALKGTVHVKSARLGPAGEGSELPPLSAVVDLDLPFSGQALTPRGLVASLVGEGQARLADGVLNGLSPHAVNEAAVLTLAPNGSLSPGALEQVLRRQLAKARISLGRRRMALRLKDGVVTPADISLDAEGGRILGTTAIDLESLRIVSEWRLEPKPEEAAGGRRGALPAVTRSWVAPLGRVDAATSTIRLEALERELGVRRMELEVEALERLRREDEERARQEAERQRLLAAEREKEAEARRREAIERAGGQPASPVPPAPAAPRSDGSGGVGTPTPATAAPAPPTLSPDAAVSPVPPASAGAPVATGDPITGPQAPSAPATEAPQPPAASSPPPRSAPARPYARPVPPPAFRPLDPFTIMRDM